MPSSGICSVIFEYEGLTGDNNLVCRKFFGTLGDRPMTLDIDGDGIHEVGVYRPGSATLYVTPSTGSCPPQIPGTLTGYDGRTICTAVHGLPGDIAGVGDFDGDGRDELVAFYPPSGFHRILLAQRQLSRRRVQRSVGSRRGHPGLGAIR